MGIFEIEPKLLTLIELFTKQPCSDFEEHNFVSYHARLGELQLVSKQGK